MTETAEEAGIAPVTALRGVGHAKAARLARLGIRSVRDLLLTLPARLLVWPEPASIRTARSRKGELVTVEGRVARSVLQRIGGKRSIVRATLADGTGEIDLVFFNQPWMKEQLAAGTPVVAHGPIVDARGGPAIGTPRLGTDEKPLPPPGTLAPVYAAGDGVSPEALAGWIAEALERFGDRLQEPLPAAFLERVEAPDLREAAFAMHRPTDEASFERARRRFALHPILVLQARVHARRRASVGRARAATLSEAKHRDILGRFPFTLTEPQLGAVGDIRDDLARTRPMRRLLQGDVGSGKTAVAAYAAMAACEAGGQVALMAPTEVLASQHAYGLAPLLQSFDLRTALLTGTLPAGERRAVAQRLCEGDLDVVFGTHALFSDDIAFRRLDLAIVDEQHRFGVAQRDRLAAKGRDVHVLLMTATPIPRTLALTVYGDLDVSIVDGAPPGRGEIVTRWARGDDRRRMPRFLMERLDAGEQIYWVVPRIGAETDAEESAQRASAEARYADLIKRPRFAAAGVELVHGRLATDERATRLDRFRRGEIATLVATTVVEVGVDVANAT
ncbi:MAG: DEAD/DEAH box helicase, partial [Planctomycetota bacterium]